MKPSSRKLLMVSSVCIGGLLVALVVLPFAVGGERFRPLLRAQLEQKLHSQVSLGKMELRTFPLALRVSDVSVSQPAGFPVREPFVQAKEVFVSVALWPLLKQEVRIQSVRLQSPRMELVKGATGKWNYDTGSSGDSNSVTLDELTVNDGLVALHDLKSGAAREVYEHIDATLQNLGAGRLSSLTGSMRLDSMAAALKIQTEFETEPSMKAKGTLTLTSERVPDVLRVEYDLAEGSLGGALLIRAFDAKLGSLSASASGSVSTKQTPPGLALKLKTSRAPIADLMRLAGLAGVTLPGGLKAEGNLQAEIEVKGTSEKPLFSGSIRAGRTQLSSKDLAEPVRTSELEITLTPQAAVSNSFTVETGATKVTAQATIADYSTATPRVTAALQAPAARIEELLRIAGAYGAKPAGLNGSGALNLDLKLVQVGSATTYSGSGSVRNAKFTSPDLPQELAVENADIKFSEDRVVLDGVQAALGTMHITGKLSLKDFARPKLDFNLHADTIDVEELSRMATGTASGPAKPATGKPGAAKPVLNLTAQGLISIDKLTYEKTVVSHLKATADLSGGILKLSPVTAGIFGGEQAGSMTADLRGANTTYAIQSKLTGVDSSQLLAATSSVKGIVSGPFSGDLDLRFVSAPQSAPGQEIASTLNGTVQMQMGPGRIAGVQIMNEIARVGNLLGFTRKQEAYTNINRLAGTLNIQNGVASTNDLLLDLGGVILRGSGTMGLVDQSLKLRLNAVMTKEYLQKNGLGQAGGILNVISGGKEDVALPLLVNGTFGQPKFALDSERVGKTLLSSPQGIVGGVSDLLNRFKKK